MECETEEAEGVSLGYPPSMKSAMPSWTASTMCPQLAVLQPPACAAARNGVTPFPAITSPANMDDVSRAPSTGERIVVLHAHGCRVEHKIAAGGIRHPGRRAPIANAGEHAKKSIDRDWSASWMTISPTLASSSAMAIALPEVLAHRQGGRRGLAVP